LRIPPAAAGSLQSILRGSANAEAERRRMSMLEFPIRRYQFTLVVFFCLVALGWFTFSQMPREEDPSFKISGFSIAAIMPGADPKDLERLVVKPIEDRLAELDDVRDIESTVVDGLAFTVIEFEAFTDAEKKYDEVTREVNALRAIAARPKSAS
jgi:multidrug efflux pump subunit AcrB